VVVATIRWNNAWFVVFDSQNFMEMRHHLVTFLNTIEPMSNFLRVPRSLTGSQIWICLLWIQYVNSRARGYWFTPPWLMMLVYAMSPKKPSCRGFLFAYRDICVLGASTDVKITPFSIPDNRASIWKVFRHFKMQWTDIACNLRSVPHCSVVPNLRWNRAELHLGCVDC
jgi:hypothetical protein